MSRLYQINEEDLRALEGMTSRDVDNYDPWVMSDILDRVRYPEAPKDDAPAPEKSKAEVVADKIWAATVGRHMVNTEG